MSTSGHLVVKLLAAPTDGKRTVTGWASTDDVDLVGDIVDPAGLKVSLPIPLLFGHNHESIIGSVTSVVPDAKRVRIEATIVEGTAKADEAWTLIRAGALTSFSVGFIGHKSTPISTGGRRWESWTLTEVSAVAVPANPHAKITATSNAKSIARKSSGSPLSRDVQAAILRACGRFIRKQLEPRDAEIKSLRSEVARLSENPVSYQGPYNRVKTYARGDVVTSGGSAFFCVRDGVSSAPTHEGSDAVSADWQIFVRRGRDARGESR